LAFLAVFGVSESALGLESPAPSTAFRFPGLVSGFAASLGVETLEDLEVSILADLLISGLVDFPTSGLGVSCLATGF